MIELQFSAEYLGRIRFAVSPLKETVLSIRTLAAGTPGLNSPWLQQGGPGRKRREALLGELVAEPAEGLARIIAELDRFWRIAIAPHWPRMRTLLQADLNHRLDELASGGVDQLFRTLHRQVSFHGDSLRIAKYFTGQAHLRQRGLLLIPCVFAAPDVIVGTADSTAATVAYPPHGLGRLWSALGTSRTKALSDVVGSSRAAILAALDLPMSTTALAAALHLSAPTMNVHLKALEAAGIVTARRDGRTVLYARTGIGDQLLDPHVRS